MDREEFVARKICEAVGDDPDALVLIGKDLPRTRQGYMSLPDLSMNAFHGWHFYRAHARAAIEALREFSTLSPS